MDSRHYKINEAPHTGVFWRYFKKLFNSNEHTQSPRTNLLDENKKIEQVNVNKIISKNNESNKLKFIQMLEDKKIKLDIMETLKTTMGQNNK